MFANVDNGYGVFANFFLDILRLSYFIIYGFLIKKSHGGCRHVDFALY